MQKQSEVYQLQCVLYFVNWKKKAADFNILYVVSKFKNVVSSNLEYEFHFSFIYLIQYLFKIPET